VLGLNSWVACNIVNAEMTAQSGPAHESFERFLHWLSPDRDLALRKYDEIMQKTRKHFVRKACLDSEDLVAETRDRVVKIVSSGSNYPNQEALFFSVATNVWHEHLRKPRLGSLPDDDLLPIVPQETEEKELQANCLERCLAQLSDSERDLIVRYYQGRGRNNIDARKQLMAEHGGENTLRVKAFRIRTKLRACMGDCMRRDRK